MTDIMRRLRSLIYEEEYLEEAANEIEQLRTALMAAKTELEWWIAEHGCCKGHEDEAMATIDAALNGAGQALR